MSVLDHLHALARGNRPPDDGLLANTRCAWGNGELLGEEAILAAFSERPFAIESELFTVETSQGAALIGEHDALVADLYGGRIGRLWRVGPGISFPPELAIDVAFDPDMRQARGDLNFCPEDHPELDPAAGERLLAAAADFTHQVKCEGKLRVRAFGVRAFGNPKASAALLSLYALGNETNRTASFSYAVIGAALGSDVIRVVREQAQPRDWTPRL